jgi:hypothetical protein
MIEIHVPKAIKISCKSSTEILNHFLHVYFDSMWIIPIKAQKDDEV